MGSVSVSIPCRCRLDWLQKIYSSETRNLIRGKFKNNNPIPLVTHEKNSSNLIVPFAQVWFSTAVTLCSEEIHDCCHGTPGWVPHTPVRINQALCTNKLGARGDEELPNQQVHWNRAESLGCYCWCVKLCYCLKKTDVHNKLVTLIRGNCTFLSFDRITQWQERECVPFQTPLAFKILITPHMLPYPHLSLPWTAPLLIKYVWIKSANRYCFVVPLHFIKPKPTVHSVRKHFKEALRGALE